MRNWTCILNLFISLMLVQGLRINRSSKILASLRRQWLSFPNGFKLRSAVSPSYNGEDIVAHLRSAINSKVSHYWLEQLSGVEKPIAKSLISQLTSLNVAGYLPSTGPVREGTLVDFYIQEKVKHPDKIILMRCGDFYESYGIDAVMLVSHCGLNPMGGKCKAGCPISNIQATLDGLTSAGLTVAVYEELSDLESSRGPSSSKMKLKTRFLSQIVSPASSTYAYDLTLRNDDIEFPENRPVLGEVVVLMMVDKILIVPTSILY
jgi:hypothetical protein